MPFQSHVNVSYLNTLAPTMNNTETGRVKWPKKLSSTSSSVAEPLGVLRHVSPKISVLDVFSIISYHAIELCTSISRIRGCQNQQLTRTISVFTLRWLLEEMAEHVCIWCITSVMMFILKLKIQGLYCPWFFFSWSTSNSLPVCLTCYVISNPSLLIICR